MNRAIDDTLTVTELNQLVSSTMNKDFSKIRVTGEVADVKIVSSGHVYFTLKDENCYIYAVCFKNIYQIFSSRLKNGAMITVTANLNVKNSRCQLIVLFAKNIGVGELNQILLERRILLEKEGLFSLERKRPIPSSLSINKIGLITSANGAVLHDIISRISIRFPKHILLYDVNVQGEFAERDIILAMKYLNSMSSEKAPDVIIIARGGGSLEDLMPFNGEALARCVANSAIPTISAIGHEIDYTIVDLVSDCRMPTPTAAGDLVTATTKADILAKMDILRHSLHRSFFLTRNRYIENLQYRLVNTMERKMEKWLWRLQSVHSNLSSVKMISKVLSMQMHLQDMRKKLEMAYDIKVNAYKFKLEYLSKRLESLNVLNQLRRGYMLIKKEGRIISSVADVSLMDELDVVFRDGIGRVRVIDIKRLD